MAKIKVKQIEDLSLVDSLLTVGSGTVNQVSFLEGTEGKYVYGFEINGRVVKPTFADLPTVPAVTIPEVAGQFVLNAVVNKDNNHQIDLTRGTFDVTVGETLGSLNFTGNKLSVNDAWVKSLFDVTDPTITGELAESSTFVTGIDYDKETGKFTYTVGKTVSAKNGNLSIAFADSGISSGVIFSANEGIDKTLTLAKVAGSGAAADVTFGESNVANTLTDVITRLGNLETAKPTTYEVTAGTGINVTLTSNEVEGQTVKTFEVSTDFTVDTIKYGEDAGDKAGKTYIRIMDGTTVISETDAAAFVKDGFLQSVTKDDENNTITFTWNAEAGVQETTISIKELCDVYTADETYLHLENYKFSHKTQTGLTAGQYAANTADQTADAAGESVEFKVPSITVDAAGHVTAASEKTIKVAIPEAIKLPEFRQGYDSYVVTKENAAAQTFTIAPAGNKQPLGVMVVYLNGQALIEGAGKDYVSTTTGATINNPLPALAYNNNVEVRLEEGDVISYSYIYAV